MFLQYCICDQLFMLLFTSLDVRTLWKLFSFRQYLYDPPSSLLIVSNGVLSYI